ncbi:MAG: hypothetical protein RLY72_795 [Planctomycetota bacterium]|jgi:hypothetical protein
MDGLYCALVISSTMLRETVGDLISQRLGLGYGGDPEATRRRHGDDTTAMVLLAVVSCVALFTRVSRASCKKDDAPGQARGVA